MEVIAAILLVLVAPPLIALRWDGHKLHVLRRRAASAGIDPHPASSTSYLRRARPSFALMSAGLAIGVLGSALLDWEKWIAILVAAPPVLAALFLQHRAVRGIERDLFG